MKSRRKWVTFAAWIPFIMILIGVGCMGLWASETSPYMPDEAYLDWVEKLEKGEINEAPPALPESQRSFSFWSSIGFIVVGVLIAVIIFVPVILSVLR